MSFDERNSMPNLKFAWNAENGARAEGMSQMMLRNLGDLRQWWLEDAGKSATELGCEMQQLICLWRTGVSQYTFELYESLWKGVEYLVRTSRQSEALR